MKAYTYLIGWSKKKKFYYGVRFAKGCNPKELFHTYFTSSKHVHSFMKENGMPDIVEVRKMFDEIDSARNWETKVLKRMNVVMREDFLNKTDNISIDRESCSSACKGKFGKDHPSYGQKKPHLTEYNKKNNSTRNKKYSGSNHPHHGKYGIAHHRYGKEWNNFVMEEYVTCPHCNKNGKRGGMQRWHFDHCKLNTTNKKGEKDANVG